LNKILSSHYHVDFLCHYCRVYGVSESWGATLWKAIESRGDTTIRIAPNSEWPVFPTPESFSVTKLFIPTITFDVESRQEVIEWTFPTKPQSSSTGRSCDLRLYHGGTQCDDLLVDVVVQLETEHGDSFEVKIRAVDLFRSKRSSIKLFEFRCEFMSFAFSQGPCDQFLLQYVTLSSGYFYTGKGAGFMVIVIRHSRRFRTQLKNHVFRYYHMCRLNFNCNPMCTNGY
jgi:hypothetical protein